MSYKFLSNKGKYQVQMLALSTFFLKKAVDKSMPGTCSMVIPSLNEWSSVRLLSTNRLNLAGNLGRRIFFGCAADVHA
jgi:hypothetical protein